MISVLCGPDDIAAAMISATQMIYATRMTGYYIIFAKQIYHPIKLLKAMAIKTNPPNICALCLNNPPNSLPK